MLYQLIINNMYNGREQMLNVNVQRHIFVYPERNNPEI